MQDLAKNSFSKIAPFWPLENLIAVNPLQGLEDLPIEEALKIGAAYFEQENLPEEMLWVNMETIKWLSAYFDEGQATIHMPFKHLGLYNAWRHLAVHDEKLHQHKKENQAYLNNLSKNPEKVISDCFIKLGIDKKEQVEFLTLLLTTLPGWASYIKYKSEWASPCSNSDITNQLDYIAIRILITTLLWPAAKSLLSFHRKGLENSQSTILENVKKFENAYRIPLLKKIASQSRQKPHTPESQFIFCIDVRSEPFRKSLESTGDYQTLGFAGFFGIPVQIKNKITGVSYPSCPVLLKPKYEITEAPNSPQEYLICQKNNENQQLLKKLYQSTKYTFSSTFALVETLGGLAGIWMGMRTLTPKLAAIVRTVLNKNYDKHAQTEPSIEEISFEDKCSYAENALKMMGLTDHFAPMIFLCGHGSSTQNNAYATSLDCGACGGRHGGSNAKILAAILNTPEVRVYLAKGGIIIPSLTKFIAAEHNTTTDEVVLFCESETNGIQKIKQNLIKARQINNKNRLEKLKGAFHKTDECGVRAQDWAQVRPEWGLARNAAFIIAPRAQTDSIDLDGRCFLHSYDYKQDPTGVFLTTILTAPVVVAQWINMQYFFSTINNVAYGGGSKITKNIIGKIGIMQGNASDLMNGLPLQSVYETDVKAYHDPQRLMVVVLATKNMVDKIIQQQDILQKLFGHGWVQMTVIEPEDNKIYALNRDLTWNEVTE